MGPLVGPVLRGLAAASPTAAEPGLGLRQLAFDPYLLVIPPDWQVRPCSLRDLAGRPWVAGAPGTACDHALRRLAAEAAITIPPGDVCVEFPSVLALVEAGRGAAVIPQMITPHPLAAKRSARSRRKMPGPAGLKAIRRKAVPLI